MIEIVRIKDPDQRVWAESQARAGIASYEKKALDYSLGDDFNIYEAAHLSSKRMQYEDFYLFAAYPRLYALAKRYLDKQFGSDWGDRNGLGRHIPALIGWLGRLGVTDCEIGDGTSFVHQIVPAVRYLTPYSVISRIGAHLGQLETVDSGAILTELGRRNDSCGVRLFVASEKIMVNILDLLVVLPGTRLKVTRCTVGEKTLDKEARFLAPTGIGAEVRKVRQSYDRLSREELIYHGIHVYLTGQGGLDLPNKDGRMQVQLLFQAAARMRVVTSAALRKGGPGGLNLAKGDLDKLVEKTMLEFKNAG